MKTITSLVFLALTFLLLSCDKNRLFESYQSVDGSWHKDSVFSFIWEQTDQKPVNLFLMVRNNHDYEFNNLFIISKIKFPNNRVLVDTLEYAIANADGSFIDKQYSHIIENKLFIKENYKLQPGTYEITIEQANRKIGAVEPLEKLNGIIDVGIRVEQYNNK